MTGLTVCWCTAVAAAAQTQPVYVLLARNTATCSMISKQSKQEKYALSKLNYTQKYIYYDLTII